jgi:uncharacterized repeat protein (TIGR01451 family)
MKQRDPRLVLAAAAVLVIAMIPAIASSAPGDQADLKLTKSDSPDPVTVGDVLTYTIALENLGPAAASAVKVTDNLPSTVDFVSASNGCTLKGRRVTCDVGNLAASGSGAAQALTIRVRPKKADTISNTASVSSAETDPQAANSSDTEATVVKPKPTPPAAATCDGFPATIRGTNGPDDLPGTGGPDVVVAFSGNDDIATGAGNDLVCAGPGNDSVATGSAGDGVFGGGGADLILGRGGADLLRGNRGRDNLIGNRGNDRLRGGANSDRCRGGPGFDSLRSCER